MRVNHNAAGLMCSDLLVVSDLCKDTKMRVNHNKEDVSYPGKVVVSDLCKDTKMRVNHNSLDYKGISRLLFLIYAKILK